MGVEKEATKVYRSLESLLGLIDIPNHASSFFGYKAKFMESSGGILASLNVMRVFRHEYPMSKFPEIDLGYSVTKEIRVFVGSIDVSEQIKKSPLILRELEFFLRELYNYHEKYYLCSREGDILINELFLMDGVDVVVGENSSVTIDIDHSLRDYLVSLNERLRISA